MAVFLTMQHRPGIIPFISTNLAKTKAMSPRDS